MMTQELTYRIDTTVLSESSVEERWYREAKQSPKIRPLSRLYSVPPRRDSHRWGIILAGGDGTRLRALTANVWRDRPKQFCPILSDRTLLDETRRRAEQSIPPEQILFSVVQAHQRYYLPILEERLPQTIVQPSNKGTAPAILSALMRIAQADENAIVSILPCDHYYAPESNFTNALDSALNIAQERIDSVVLLGVQPNEPEIEYGWIEIGEAVNRHSELFRVQGFEEKPPLALAQSLLRRGSLWNTFVMVGHVRAFLDMAWETVPILVALLESRYLTSRGDAEICIPASIYSRIPPTDFSRKILAFATDRLLTLRLKDTKWSDLGDPSRVLVTLLEKDGDLPVWATLWTGPKPTLRTMAAYSA
jgi:mannose-1-phosphate guanylyltransferase